MGLIVMVLGTMDEKVISNSGLDTHICVSNMHVYSFIRHLRYHVFLT